MKNVLRDIPDHLPEERFDTLVRTDSVHIERIVSRGHASPEQGWYDQAHREWVLVLKGAARLVFDDGGEVSLGPGDTFDIAAHRKHRVAWTDPKQETVWLAVHYPR